MKFSASPFKRISALAILAAMIAAPYFLVVVPILAMHERLDERIAEAQKMFVTLQGIGAQQDVLRQEIEEIERHSTESGLYLSGETGSVAAAKLQQSVNSLIRRSKGQIKSLKTMPVKIEHGCEKVTVSVELKATMPALQKILYALEAKRPLLVVSDMQALYRAAGRRTSQGLDPLLEIRFEVSGFLRPVVS